MLLGCCTSKVDNAQAAVRSGADFIEVGLAGIMAMSDADFTTWADQLDAAGVRVHASNGFMPGDIKVVGPAVDQARVDEYVGRGAARLQRLGVRVAVFGSSGSRQVPDGFDPLTARGQLADFLGRAARTLGERGITLALEPLCAAESNLVNTVGDGLALIREGCPEVRVLADFFHMTQEAEGFDVLEEAGDLLAHVHVSTTGRRGVTDGDADAAEFVRRLADTGYRGGCSLECGWDDFPAEIGASIAALRRWAA